LANEGLPVVWKRDPFQPGKKKDREYGELVSRLKALSNVSDDLGEIIDHPPLISGDSIPDYWCRVRTDGTHCIFLSQWGARDVQYPVYSGQSYMDQSSETTLMFNIDGRAVSESIEFRPYQSVMLEIGPGGNVEYIDITFIPNDPQVRPKEKQRMYF
jgi:hypothetical protein